MPALQVLGPRGGQVEADDVAEELTSAAGPGADARDERPGTGPSGQVVGDERTVLPESSNHGGVRRAETLAVHEAFGRQDEVYGRFRATAIQCHELAGLVEDVPGEPSAPPALALDSREALKDFANPVCTLHNRDNSPA